MVQLTNDKTGKSFVLTALRQQDAEQFGHLVGGHSTCEQPRAVVASPRLGLGALLIRAKSAGDGVEDVCGGYDTFEVPVLIMNNGNRYLRVTQHLKHVEGVDGIGNDWRPSNVASNIQGLTRQQSGQQLARLNDTDHVVGASECERY